MADVIEEYVNVRGVPLKLIDTAGIRETEDKVERIGVERSRKAIEQADLVMLVLKIKEVIMATNPTVEGEATAMYISKLLKLNEVKK